jgi:uncharacterized protein (TIGR03083 family)
MESKRLLEHLDSEYRRLREVSADSDLDRPVPTCPGWSLADLTSHVGLVYLHKVRSMRSGGAPESQWPPPDAAAEEPRSLLERTYAELSAEFAARPPEETTFTWYAPDQTVGFWIRRMAQETVIHRIDAELAAGVAHAPVADDLALDGIDEVLRAFVEFGSRAWGEEFTPVLSRASGQPVRLETDGAAWEVRLTPRGVDVAGVDGAAGPGTAAVRGGPTELLLWLWGRAGDEAVSVRADADLIADLRRILVIATQ